MDELERLERLRHSGGLSDTEFQQAKTKLFTQEIPTGATSDSKEFTRMKRELELMRLDRAWELEQLQYMVRERSGNRLPSTQGSSFSLILGFAVGGFFVWLWTTANSSFSPAPPMFLVLAATFSFVGVCGAISEATKLEGYTTGLRIYRERRSQIYNG